MDLTHASTAGVDRPQLCAGTAPGEAAQRYRSLTYVVGHSRGGTTWLGGLLNCHALVRYIFEPFASQAHPCTGVDAQTLFNGGRFIRLGKQRVAKPTADIPLTSFFRGPAQDPQSQRLAGLARMHLDRLVELYFGKEQGFHLVIKQPRLENVGWAGAALQATHVVVLNRHPFGVVNSIRRWNVFSWHHIEWQHLCQDKPLVEQHRKLIADAQTAEERLLVLSYLRDKHVHDYVANDPRAIAVDYEQLCIGPLAEIKRLWGIMKLDDSANDRERLTTQLSKTEPEATGKAAFHDINKDPLTRVHAWRSELPFALQKRMMRFVERHQLAIPIPGQGLPPLSSRELMISRRNDVLSIGQHCRTLVRRLRGADRPKAA